MICAVCLHILSCSASILCCIQHAGCCNVYILWFYIFCMFWRLIPSFADTRLFPAHGKKPGLNNQLRLGGRTFDILWTPVSIRVCIRRDRVRLGSHHSLSTQKISAWKPLPIPWEPSLRGRSQGGSLRRKHMYSKLKKWHVTRFRTDFTQIVQHGKHVDFGAEKTYVWTAP